MTSIELTSQEKELFLNWVEQRQKIITDELAILKNLYVKLNPADPEVKAKLNQNKVSQSKEEQTISSKGTSATSWVNIVKTELAHFTHPVTSGEIVNRLLQKPTFEGKGKRFITKAVTSKLWLLQERGAVIKSRENDKYVYSLKK